MKACEKQMRALISSLKEEVLGHLLAEAVSKRNEHLLKEHIVSADVKPRVSYLELIALAVLYCPEKMNEEKLVESVKKHYWVGVIKYVVNRLKKLGLIEEIDNEVMITENGKRLVEDAVRIRDEVKRAVQKDSFFGWAYRELNQNWD